MAPAGFLAGKTPEETVAFERARWTKNGTRYDVWMSVAGLVAGRTPDEIAAVSDALWTKWAIECRPELAAASLLASSSAQQKSAGLLLTSVVKPK